jgi:tetratricopeptide (TPR) repeat protein
MPEYLLTGRDAAGKSTTERVEAESADDAVRIAREAMGLSDVVLHTDDAGALYQRQKDVAATISPRDYLLFRNLPAPVAGFLVVAKASYFQQRWVLLLMLGLFALRRAQGAPWNWIDWIAAYLLLAPAVFAAVAQVFRGQAGRYNQLIDAVAWGRWEEVLQRAEALEGSKVPPEELAFQRAQALARLGRLEEGLAVVAPFGDGEAMPEWLHLSRLSDVHGGARRFDEAHAVLKRAAELAPENPTVLLDVAMFEVRRRRDPRRAREFLERARTHALSDLVAVFAQAIEGQIVREEGRPSEAVELLEDAHRRLSAFRHASPLLGVSLDLLEADTALALAADGRADAALRHARAALPRLRALDANDLIDRLRSALGPALED